MDQSDSSRPYYNPDTFNIGYSAVFRPGIGILDPYNVTLTDKLAIISKDNHGTLSMVNNSIGSLGNIKSIVPLDPVVEQSSVKALWNKFDVKKYLNSLYSLLIRQICLQPFQVAKLLLQLLSPDNSRSDGPSLDKLNATSNNTEQQVVAVEEEDIDFFPQKFKPSLQHDDHQSLFVPLSSHSHSNKIDSDDIQNNDNKLKLGFAKLDTWTIITTLQHNLGWKSLWTSFQNMLLYDTLYPLCTYILKRGLLTPVLSIFIQPIKIIYSLTTQTLLNCTVEFITESILLLPITLNSVKDVMFMGLSPNFKSRKDVYWFYDLQWNQTLITIHLFTLLKVIINNMYHHLFESIVVSYYGINLSHLSSHERLLIIITLNLVIDSIQLIVKLPLESLVNRFKWKYVIESDESGLNKDPASLPLVFRPIDVHSQEIWTGLWRGWRLHLISRICGTIFKYLNGLGTDLEWEKF